MNRLATAILVCVISIGSAEAKRMPPKPVAPVVAAGVKYFSDGNGRDEIIAAKELSSGKILWRKRIAHNTIMFGLEEDVQWSFVTEIKLDGDHLIVRDEKSRCFQIDLYKQHVKKCP